jgi:inner membrane protein
MQWLVDLYANQPYWVWVAIAAALLAIEVVTGSGWLLWASAAAGVVALATFAVDLSFAVEILLFAVLTMASTLLARRYFPRSITAGAGDINDNIGRLVGHRGSAVQAFAGRAGRVFIDGKEWAAELAEGDGLEAGAPVEVTGVQGARLLVRPA